MAVNVTDLSKQGFSERWGSLDSSLPFDHFVLPRIATEHSDLAMFPPGRIATTAGSRHTVE